MILLLAAVLTHTVWAAGGPLRIDDALTRARTASPLLRAAAAEIDAARARLVQARVLAANPVVSVDLARHTAPTEEQIDRGVELAQEVEVGGQRGLRIEVARYDVVRAEHLLADRRRTVDAEVRRSFFALVAGERRALLARESAVLAERLAEATRRRARAGDVGVLDVRLSELEAVRAAQAVASAEEQRAAAAAQLAVAMGSEALTEATVVAEEDEPGHLPPEAELVEHALATRPDLAAARAVRTRLEAEAGLVRRRSLVPNPILRGFYRNELFDERIVGGGISVPLPVWNRDRGTEAALRAQAVAAGAAADRLAAEIPHQVRLALVRRTVAAESFRRYRRDARPAVAAARDALERAYGAGYVGLTERVVQQDRLIQVQAAAIDAWRDFHLAEADLIEAAGGELE
jgi:cobalt-zinc-cadmium efflux system outer membrane protein